MKIISEPVPASAMPYKTCGNWTFLPNGDLYVTVLEGLTRECFLTLANHEIDEALDCQEHGVTEESVNAFDIDFERRGLPGEPGDDPSAPYFKFHRKAEAVERARMATLGISWDWYSAELDRVFDAAFPPCLSGVNVVQPLSVAKNGAL